MRAISTPVECVVRARVVLLRSESQSPSGNRSSRTNRAYSPDGPPGDPRDSKPESRQSSQRKEDCARPDNSTTALKDRREGEGSLEEVELREGLDDDAESEPQGVFPSVRLEVGDVAEMDGVRLRACDDRLSSSDLGELYPLYSP